jgi:Amt family ammonium transporter
MDLTKLGYLAVLAFLSGETWGHIKLRIPIYAYFLFQAAFAVAMASIVSGAVAERMKFGPYIVYTALAAGLIYPVAGHWVWGVGGWQHQFYAAP